MEFERFRAPVCDDRLGSCAEPVTRALPPHPTPFSIHSRWSLRDFFVSCYVGVLARHDCRLYPHTVQPVKNVLMCTGFLTLRHASTTLDLLHVYAMRCDAMIPDVDHPTHVHPQVQHQSKS